MVSRRSSSSVSWGSRAGSHRVRAESTPGVGSAAAGSPEPSIPQPHEHPPAPPVPPSAHSAPQQHPPSPQRSRPSAAGGTSCSRGSAQKLLPGWPGRSGEMGERSCLGKHPWVGEHPLPGVGCKRVERGNQGSRGRRPAPAPHTAGTQSGMSCSGQQLPRGLTLADSWDVRVATFSCEDSSSRRSLRICCGERAEGVRGQALTLTAVAGAGNKQRVRAHLGLHLLLSLVAREQRERQTDRGRQSGGQRGTDRLSTRQRHAQSPPCSHPGPPSHAQSGAAQRRLLRRSRWRTRSRPGTAPIHELQQNKTRRVRVPLASGIPRGCRCRA